MEGRISAPERALSLSQPGMTGRDAPEPGRARPAEEAGGWLQTHPSPPRLGRRPEPPRTRPYPRPTWWPGPWDAGRHVPGPPPGEERRPRGLRVAPRPAAPLYRARPAPAPLPGAFTCCREPDTARQKASRGAGGRGPAGRGRGGPGSDSHLFLNSLLKGETGLGASAPLPPHYPPPQPRSCPSTPSLPAPRPGGAAKLHPQRPHTYFREQDRLVIRAGPGR